MQGMSQHNPLPLPLPVHPFQDRLPSPFGLVRSGVAPDHQDTKVGVHQGVARAVWHMQARMQARSTIHATDVTQLQGCHDV